MRLRIALVATAAALAVAGCAGEGPAPDPPPAPDVGRPVVLDNSVPGWETSVWLAGKAFCVRAARAGGKRADGRENESVFCDPAPSALREAGSPALPAKPEPYLAPLDPASQKILLVGTVRGTVAGVSVTMFGETATADVHRLPATGGREVGAYAVWLPRSGAGRDGMDRTDITEVVARDPAGRIVARLS
jgi:hypothetical protein